MFRDRFAGLPTGKIRCPGITSKGYSSAKKQAKRTVPEFRSEGKEREFWAGADSADYVDLKAARKVVFPKLKPTQRTIYLRLPAMMLAELQLLANKRDVPYLSLSRISSRSGSRRN